MAAQTRLKLTVLGSILVVGAAIWFALTAYLSPHCVPLDRLATIRMGSTKQEVVALLGPPQSDKKVENHRELWYWQLCGIVVYASGSMAMIAS